jgi:F-type H+-transporting ATPase subunit epsilon
MPFQFTLLTPERRTFDATVTQAIIPAHDGLMGFLTGRSPIITMLGAGPLRVDLPEGRKRFFYVGGGVAQMKNNHLTLLSSEALAAEEIDPATADAEYAEASARRAIDEKAVKQREQAIARARAKREVARLKQA